MLRDRVESIRSSLVVTDSHAAKDRIHRRTQKGELIRLLAGIYIPSARLIGLNLSERRTAVFIARMCALSLRYPDYVMSGIVAAYLLGLPCEAHIGQLTLYAPSRKCPIRVHFPEVVIDDSIRIPSVCVRSARAVLCLPSSTSVFALRPRPVFSLIARARWTTSTLFPSLARL